MTGRKDFVLWYLRQFGGKRLRREKYPPLFRDDLEYGGILKSNTPDYNILEGARGAEPGLQTGFPRGNENRSTRFPIPEATQSNLERAESVRLQHRHLNQHSHVHISAQQSQLVTSGVSIVPRECFCKKSAFHFVLAKRNLKSNLR